MIKTEKLTDGHPKFNNILQDIAELHNRKNADYAKGGRQGPLGNFYRTAQFKRLYPGFDWTTPFGTAVDYLLKQLDAAMILAATNRDSVTGEGIPSRFKDVAVYSIIAMILWEEQINGSGRIKNSK